MTFSILASDPKSGQMGYAIASGAPDVGILAPRLAGGVGAVSAQGLPSREAGGRAMHLLDQGATANEAVNAVSTPDKGRGRRQFLALDAKGDTAAFTGEKCEPFAGAISKKGILVAGNMLKGRRVLTDMLQAFEGARAEGQDLGECLMRSVEAGHSAGGDRRGLLSCAIEVQGQGGEVITYLSIPSAPDPIEEMRRQFSEPDGARRGQKFTGPGDNSDLPESTG